MLKYPITYTDYNNVIRTEDFYFNLNKAEVMEMELGTTGGYTEMIRKIISAQDTPTLVTVFKEFILKAYGEKSPDGKRLMKSKEIAEAFAQTEAYSELFMSLATDADKARKMIEAIVKEPEPGEIYYGKVVRLMNFGAFVNLLPGKDGMVHISKMADHRIEKVEDAVKEGDMVWVKVMEIDDKGRVNLSMKDVKPEEKVK